MKNDSWVRIDPAFTGELLHVALAMKLHEQTQVVIPLAIQNTDANNYEQSVNDLKNYLDSDTRQRPKAKETLQYLKYLADIGIQTNRIHTFKTSSPNVTQNSGLSQKQAQKHFVNQKIYSSWASTPLLMQDPQRVLSLNMAEGISEDLKHKVKTIFSKMTEGLEEEDKYVFLMTRKKKAGDLSSDHSEHDTNHHLIKQIWDATATRENLKLIIIGSHSFEIDGIEKNHTSSHFHQNHEDFHSKASNTILQWKLLQNACTTGEEKDYPFGDKRAQVYFWQLAREQKEKCLGVIGGTSGSLDIAAFSGVPTLSWSAKINEDFTYAVSEEYIKDGKTISVVNCEPSPQEQFRLKTQQMLPTFNIIYKQNAWGGGEPIDDTGIKENLLDTERLNKWFNNEPLSPIEISEDEKKWSKNPYKPYKTIPNPLEPITEDDFTFAFETKQRYSTSPSSSPLVADNKTETKEEDIKRKKTNAPVKRESKQNSGGSNSF